IMSITKEQQQALDDALVPREQRLRIGNCNYRLSISFKPKEPTFQVALDALSLTPFYQAFLISANICRNLPSQKFVNLSFEEEILAFIRKLGYFRDFKSLFDVKKTEQAPKASPGKRLKATAKVAKSGKKKLPAKGLEVLSEMTLSEAEQMKIATNRSKTQFHSSHASGSDNDGDDFVHPKFSTHDEEERQDGEDKEEECSSQRIHTPSHYESTDDEVHDEVTQGDNVEEEKLDEEKMNEEEEVNEMYRDVNNNLERYDTKMTDAPQTNVQATQVIEDTHVIITVVNPKVQQ
ncbi:hypothetical protein Tco_0644309, partial [Tanacetum coccineum]